MIPEKRNIRLCAVITALSLTLTGCWDSVALEKRGFVISLGIDQALADGSGDRYAVTMSLPNLDGILSGGESGQILKQAEDQTISSAVRRVDAYSDQELYFGQTKVCVFGGAVLADAGLFREALDALERDRDISRKLILLAAEGAAADILDFETEEAPLSGLFISNFYNNGGQSAAQTFQLDLERFTRRMRADGSGILPKIAIENGEIRLGGAAVIKDFSLAGWLTEQQVRGYLWLLGGAAGAELTADFDTARIPVRITAQKAGISLYETEGSIHCTADIYAEGSIDGYQTGDAEIFSDAALKAIQADCEQIIAAEVLATHALFRDTFAIDGFEFKERLRKYHYDLHMKYSGDWDTVYQTLEITPRVRVVIRHTGPVK